MYKEVEGIAHEIVNGALIPLWKFANGVVNVLPPGAGFSREKQESMHKASMAELEEAYVRGHWNEHEGDEAACKAAFKKLCVGCEPKAAPPVG